MGTVDKVPYGAQNLAISDHPGLLAGQGGDMWPTSRPQECVLLGTSPS